MAGQDRKGTGHGAWHRAAAVAAVLLFLILLPVLSVRADYLVKTADGRTIRTQSYRIEGAELLLAGVREPLGVYDVVSETAEDLSGEQAARRQEALEAFRARVEGLLGTEEEILETHTAQLERISGGDASGRPEIEPKAERRIRREIRSRDKVLERLKADWFGIVLPEYSLLVARDIKILQLVSLEASVEQTLDYVETGDPTSLAYAREHLRQAGSFRESFREALSCERP